MKTLAAFSNRTTHIDTDGAVVRNEGTAILRSPDSQLGNVRPPTGGLGQSLSGIWRRAFGVALGDDLPGEVGTRLWIAG